MKRLLLVLVMVTVFFATGSLAAETVRIGFLYLMSGRLAAAGTTSKQGAEIGIDEVNQSGGINGGKVVGIFKDTKGDPDLATTLVQQLVKEEGVSAIIGITSSKVALAVSEVCNSLEVPLLVTTAQTPQITGTKCNRYTFRITWSNNENLKTAVILATKTGGKKWTTVAPDYLFGHEAWTAFQQHLKAVNPGTSFVPEDEAAFAPVETTDWKPYIDKVIKSDADAVLLTLYGGNLIDFIRQAGKTPFFDGKRVVLVAVGPVPVFFALGSRTPEGIWAMTPYWYQASDSPMNKRFVEEYEKRYTFPPAFQAQFSYGAMKAFAQAAANAKTVEGKAVAEALEGLTVELPMGPLTIRPEDHQAVFGVIAGRTSKKMVVTTNKKLIRAFDPLLRLPAEMIAIPVDKTGCQMK